MASFFFVQRFSHYYRPETSLYLNKLQKSSEHALLLFRQFGHFTGLVECHQDWSLKVVCRCRVSEAPYLFIPNNNTTTRAVVSAPWQTPRCMKRGREGTRKSQFIQEERKEGRKKRIESIVADVSFFPSEVSLRRETSAQCGRIGAFSSYRPLEKVPNPGHTGSE